MTRYLHMSIILELHGTRKTTLDKIELYNIAHSIMIHSQFSRNILYSHYNLNKYYTNSLIQNSQ